MLISAAGIYNEFFPESTTYDYPASEYILEYKIVTIEEYGIEKKDTIYVLTRKDLDNKSKR